MLAVAAALAAAPLGAGAAQAAIRPRRITRTGPVRYDDVVPGFARVAVNATGAPLGSGFEGPNPWGSYTAYLASVSTLGHRTWRIENMLVSPTFTQGSTMWLFEGSSRALLVDTAQNTPDVVGVNDLKTVARHLLGHDDDGTPRADPVDFDVAISHGHGDHTGKNYLMSDRTVYFPEGDWPASAPAYYVPTREGGGPSPRGDGRAVGTFDLGDRTIHAIDLHGHTPGSTGYLDAENLLLATGDALGSAYVWMHFASGTTEPYRRMLRGMRNFLRRFEGIALLPAHFYQVNQYPRNLPPVNGRPLDADYVSDMLEAASGLLDGTIAAEPYRTVGREVGWIGYASARMTFTFANLYPGGPSGGRAPDDDYHGMAIPGTYNVPAAPSGPYAAIDNIKTGLLMIRDSANQSMYLVRGSERAVLIGSGRGTPGLMHFARRWSRGTELELVVTSDDPGQIGGLSQFRHNHVHLPRGASIPTTGLTSYSYVGQGNSIPLGTDAAGRPVALEVHALPGHSPTGITLLDPVSRVLFSGDALGEQGPGGLVLDSSLQEFAAALAAWRSRTDGRYGVVYTAHNHQWLTSPAYVDSVQAAVLDGIARGPAAYVPGRPGFHTLRSPGAADVVAYVLLPAARRARR
ncbi:MBL fold metallo-hydrolase [Motilibacter aurantiacus]|uniref:MBL fold metallo-hydrolase n=1 Tax=Motilibacter aurantiacus TaxID=2714955 RepID=UPI00140E32B4|nr:hypothetical protein [Motilibacter aurantiacus]